MKLARLALLASILAVPIAAGAGRRAPPRRSAAPSGSAPAAAHRNVVERVEVTTEPDATVVTIVTRLPATFTTRSLHARRAFVVDLPETGFARFAPVTPVGNGVVAQLESSAVVREHVPLARIALVLARDTDPPQVESAGPRLRIRIPGTPAPPPPVVAPARAPDPRRELREVSFRMIGPSAAVVMRLSGPPRFEVRELDERRVAVELPDTSIVRRNDARPLDTSFFPGAVARIESRRVGPATRVEIHLKRPAAHRERVEGDTLLIEFEPSAAP